MSEAPNTEKHEFQAEVRKLLDLMIHSIYSHKDIFLRELVSNSSDALDRLRFLGVTEPDLLPSEDLHIFLRASKEDADVRTLTIEDNGIGMSRDEVIENLGTIARSGTAEFIKSLANRKADKDDTENPELIGQFGVGFYSSFMVTDKVSVLTKRAGEDKATLWKSDGDSYTIEDATRDSCGTSVTLYLKTPDTDAGLNDYTSEYVLRDIIRKYSDFVSYPIKMMTTRQEMAPDAKEGDTPKMVVEESTLNSQKAIWTKDKSDISDEERTEFYKHISHDWTAPLTYLHTTMEGNINAKALLFVPGKAPYDLYQREMDQKGLQLYVKRVFIMDECRDLVPTHLRFIRGVVDAEDLSLNVSREILQKDQQILAIRKHLVKKIYDALKKLKKDDAEQYLKFWTEFGPVLKEGLLDGSEKRDRILDLVMVQTSRTTGDEFVALSTVIERMSEEQKDIYYLTGTSLEVARNSPHIEAFKKKNYEVIFLVDSVDEVWVQGGLDYKDKPFKSVGRGEVELGTETEREEEKKERDEKSAELQEVLVALRAKLQEHVKEVRLSTRLTESPACLVTDEGEMTPQMEALMRQMGRETPPVKRILELNPNHPIVTKLKGLEFDAIENNEAKDAEGDDSAKKNDNSAVGDQVDDFAQLLYGQALLAEGGQLPEPARFARMVADLMVRAEA